MKTSPSTFYDPGQLLTSHTELLFLQASDLIGNLLSDDSSYCETVHNLSEVLPDKFGPQSNYTTENMTDSQVNQILQFLPILQNFHF